MPKSQGLALKNICLFPFLEINSFKNLVLLFLCDNLPRNDSCKNLGASLGTKLSEVAKSIVKNI